MRFKIDENLPVEAAGALHEAGFEADTIWDEALSGAKDDVIADRVRSEDRVLITLDLDFADIRTYPPDEYAGIIVLRMRTQDKLSIVASVKRLCLVLANRSPTGELWIVERDRVRFRGSS